MRVSFCEACGAPLDAPWKELVIVCPYCGAHNAPAGRPVPLRQPVDGRPRLNLAGRTYVLEGRLAHGESSDVFRARWVTRLGELVVLKVLRSLGDADLLRNEWHALQRLHGSRALGATTMARRLPRPIALAPLRTGAIERLAVVYQWPSGFVHTLEQAGDVHGNGVDGKVLVWVLRRVLELLSWTHRSGMVHGAVLPQHVLVHPRDHGAMLVGWSTATPIGDRLPAVHRAWRALYPSDTLSDRRAAPAVDVVMAARTVLAASGGQLGDRAGTLPGALGRLVREAAQGGHDDAWSLREEVGAASLEVFGPPAYNPLPMPGWSRPGA